MGSASMGYVVKSASRLVLGPPRPHPAPVALDAQQRLVVQHQGGPLTVLGAAGSGRTTTLIETAVARIHAGTPADEVLVLSFSRRAAQDVRNRIAARLSGVALPPAVLTIHGFCHSLLRRFADPEDPRELRLLTAPEQEFRVREVLAGIPPELANWPAELSAAVGTRSFAAELRAVFARARQLAMDPEDLIEAGRRAQRPEWVAAGEFYAEYLVVLDAEGVLDYDELVHRTRLLLAAPASGERIRGELATVLVDDFHDLDPAQIALLRSLTRPSAHRRSGAELIVFADPDQSVYAFRGATPRAVPEFIEATRHGDTRAVIALGTNHRMSARVAGAVQGTRRRIPVPAGLTSEVLDAWREPEVESRSGLGQVEVLTFDSPGAEAAHLADVLRQAHLHDGVAWSQMTVLVRNGRASLPTLARELVAAGVPVEIAGDEIPLAQEPAVRPLLWALDAAASPTGPDVDQARRLLTSPLGGLDAMGVRRLGRMLRAADRIENAEELPRPSADLLRECLHDTTLLDACRPSPERDRARALADLLAAARTSIQDGAGAAEALWILWNGSSWKDRLEATALHRGDPARSADRDLDAVVALFDLAGRSQERSGQRGVATFSEEVARQQIPADTQREGDLRGGAVRLSTAHRVKGAQWSLVVVAGVQEGVWPDLRRRGTLLEADRLSTDGLGPGIDTATLLAEERRLFYLACSRARDRLVVTAVTGTEGEGDQPSRFLAELGVAPQHRSGRPRRPLNLNALVGELRRASVDPDVAPGVRTAAAHRLARLADHVPAARPARWWGTLARTVAETPVTHPELPVRLSGTAIEMVLECPRRWFASRQARGDRPVGVAATVGSVVHAVLHEAAQGHVSHDDIVAMVDRVWDQIPMEAVWFGAVEQEEIRLALGRYGTWQAAFGRTIVGSEVPFDVTVPVGNDQVRLVGTIDRIERDTDGGLHVIDFKTGRRAPRAVDVIDHSQLGVYQLAVLAGGVRDLVGPNPQLASAELVYLRVPARSGDPLPKVMRQASLQEVPWPAELAELAGEAPTWVHRQLAQAAEQLRSEEFPAVPGKQCDYCAFSTDCPALGRRTQVVL